MADETRIIQINTGTTAQWNSQVRPMKIGEFGYNKETQEVKIGDGASSFASLKAFLTGENALSQLAAVINAANGLAGLDASGKIQAARLPVIPEANLPVIPEANLPTIPTDKLPTIPEAKLPVIPEDKLPADTGKFFVGELYFQLVIRAGFVLANGQTLTGVSTKYPKLVAWLKDSSASGGAWLRRSLAGWNETWNLPGWNTPDTGSNAVRAGMCQFYVLDESANTIKMPDLRGAFQGAAGFEGQPVGAIYADTMRNIYGWLCVWNRHIYDAGDVFEPITDSENPGIAYAGTSPGGNTPNIGYTAVRFDASQQALTGSTLHPRSIVENLCVYVGNPA